MGKAISNLLIIVFYLVLGLAIGEIYVRVARYAPPTTPSGWFWKVPDSTTGWALLPNSSGRFFNQLYEFDAAVDVNSRGLRLDESIGYAKGEGIYRIMVLGDSFIEAFQVESDDTFPQQLGRHIAAQIDRPVEVIAAGAGSWGNDQQLIWLKEEGYKYQPDLILLTIYPSNDFMNNYEPLETANQGKILKPFYSLDQGELRLKYFPFEPDEVPDLGVVEDAVDVDLVEQGPLTPVAEQLSKYFALYRYADPRIRLAAPRTASWLGELGLLKQGQETVLLGQPPSFVPRAYYIYRRELAPEWEAAIETTTAIFTEFQRTAIGMGAATGAVLISAPEQVYPREWEQILKTFPAMRGWDVNLDAPTARAKDALAAAGIPVMDSVSIFRQEAGGGPRLHFKHDGHWTPAGHRLTARATFNFLAANEIVPELANQSLALRQIGMGRTLWQWFVLVILGLVIVSLLWDMIKSGPLRWLAKVAAGIGTAIELLAYLMRRRQFVLLPLVLILLLFVGLLILAQTLVVGPFIYTLI